MSKPLATVPEHWKAPFGPYRQAPADYGGEWWYVNPFNSKGTTGNNSPWERFAPKNQPEDAPLPDGFEAIFGKRPEFKDFTDRTAWTTARNHWDQNLKQFKAAGLPLWLGQEQKAELDTLYQSWDMGKPHFYGGRYGEMVRWPNSEVQDFEQAAHFAAFYPHHVIAIYQAELAEHGLEVPVGKRHPFVPPHVFPEPDEDAA